MFGMNINTGQALDGLSHLKQSITNILTTPIGSRVMRRDYGSRLFERIDSPLNGELIAEIYSDVVDALFNFEPRFKLSTVSVVSVDLGKIIIDLDGIYIPTGQPVKIEKLTIT